MSTWNFAPDIPVPETLAHFIGGHPLVAQTLVRRGIEGVAQAQAFLDPSHYVPSPPKDLPDLEAAVERIWAAIESREPICVWGDFDVDGQTATALLVHTLRELKADVTHHIPVRATESHGLNTLHLHQIIERGARLILTCDTGSDGIEAVRYARSLGADVIVSDHHKLPPTLPDAFALVSSQRLPKGHPLSTLPGVGVAYKLAEALYEKSGRPEAAAKLVDLVALGIVADVATLQGDTRYLLQRGLEELRQNRRAGLAALLESAEINPMTLDEEGIGFGLAPRMNAIGRLGDANMMVEFLTTDDPVRAAVIAAQLEGLNAERRLLTEQVAEAAEEQLARDPSLLHQSALVLSHPDWPTGILGLVASRLAESFRKPVALISAPEGQVGSGSARSIEGVDITAAIGAQQELLESFGGHAMAAGFSIKTEKIAEFSRRLGRSVEEASKKLELADELTIDAEVGLREVNMELVKDLKRLAPFGPGNPALTLACRNLTVKSSRIIGRRANHRRLVVGDVDGNSQEVLWWQGAGSDLPADGFDLAFQLQVNVFKGEERLQLIWVDARLADGSIQVIPASRKIEIIDLRAEPRPLETLERLKSQDEIVVWREGAQANQVAGVDRTGLGKTGVLAIWTIPPDNGLLAEVLEKTGAERIYVFGNRPGDETLKQFTSRLVGLLKHALRTTGGRVKFSQLSAAMSQREATVRLGIHWLAARGFFTIRHEGADEIVIRAEQGDVVRQAPEIGTELSDLLKEAAAYRNYYLRADKELLFSSNVP